jgi:Ca2+-binding EF-hand superfamily protein
MKLVKQFSKTSILLLIICAALISSNSLKKKATKLATKQDDLTKIWGDIFSKPQGENCVAATAAELAAEKAKAEAIAEPEGQAWSGPRKKNNLFDKQQGYGPSAYFFDFIDDIFQADIAKSFQTLFDDVKKLTPDEKEYKDPYPISLLASAFIPSNGPADPAADEKTLLDKIKAITKGNTKIFNENTWKNSLTAANIYKACKDFQWNYNPNENNWAKKIVDKYDFDGDGRLNPREFILMTIHHNKNILGTTCKNCYNDIVNKKIDPMFQFLDCNQDSKISTEDIWENFKGLKRKAPGKANIYGCFIKGKQYRTNAINDFMIKNMKSFDGFLNKDEWRAAILLGYWDRHTDTDKIYPDDTKTFKQLRWGPNGDTDLVCDRINNANNPPVQPPQPQSGPAPAPAAKSYFFRRS